MNRTDGNFTLHFTNIILPHTCMIIDGWNIWVWWMDLGCIKYREHEKTQYEIQSFMKCFFVWCILYVWNTNLWEYDFFLIVFSNLPIQTDLLGPVPFLKKSENRSNEYFISSDIFLTENRYKLNRYTPGGGFKWDRKRKSL